MSRAPSTGRLAQGKKTVPLLVRRSTQHWQAQRARRAEGLLTLWEQDRKYIRGTAAHTGRPARAR